MCLVWNVAIGFGETGSAENSRDEFAPIASSRS